MRMAFSHGLMALALLPAAARAEDIGDADIREYQIGLEMGCRDEAHGRGITPETIDSWCSCISDTLAEGLKREQWQEMVAAARAHDDATQQRIREPYRYKLMECVKSAHYDKARGTGSPFVDGGGIRDHLVGKWAWKLRSGCKETYEYRADGTLSTTSGAEKTDETYTVSETSEPGVFYYKLTTKVTKDYGGKDCAESEEDSTGQEDTTYVLFAASGKTAFVCSETSLKHCFGPLIRQ